MSNKVKELKSDDKYVYINEKTRVYINSLIDQILVQNEHDLPAGISSGDEVELYRYSTEILLLSVKEFCICDEFHEEFPEFEIVKCPHLAIWYQFHSRKEVKTFIKEKYNEEANLLE